ncbi:MAG: hypothetical protein JXB10_12630 [Pirellulales bacterium]|nr:hypothetical protein [Pirellulales bacterium]
MPAMIAEATGKGERGAKWGQNDFSSAINSFDPFFISALSWQAWAMPGALLRSETKACSICCGKRQSTVVGKMKGK